MILLLQKNILLKKKNSYKTSLDDLNAGNYSYLAETTLGKIIYKDEGQFLIEKLTLEQSTRGIQKAYLQYIASKTKGDMLTSPENFKKLSGVKREMKIVKKSHEIELWKKWYLAVIAILLIATELFLRKKKGLL